jgi:hypothetical protein
MTPEYRRLPGRRRGFLYPSSVWAGADHLLLVRGSRFREEYKRFYYRDVQAIAVARAPRFHFSTRSGLIAYLILIAWLVSFLRGHLGAGSAMAWFAPVALALAGVWVYVSAAQSCRCRIYTAVSGDELPSLYRLWTARKFLAEVEPLIAQTQGTIKGEWAAAAEERSVGPAIAASPETTQLNSALPRRALASDLFLVSLFADALAKIAPLRGPLASRLPLPMELITVAAAVVVLVQYNRGRLRAGMHRVAVASLLVFGTLYYVQGMTAGISAGLAAARTRKPTTALAFPQSHLALQMGAGFDAILLMAGLVVSLRRDKDSSWN